MYIIVPFGSSFTLLEADAFEITLHPDMTFPPYPPITIAYRAFISAENPLVKAASEPSVPAYDTIFVGLLFSLFYKL